MIEDGHHVGGHSQVLNDGGVVTGIEGSGALEDKRGVLVTLKQTTAFSGADANGYFNMSDFVANAFVLYYTGDATTATVTVVNPGTGATSLTTTLAGDQTDGSVDLSLTLTAYPRIQDIVDYINAQTGYSCYLNTSVNEFQFGGEYSTWLVGVAGASIAAARTMTHAGGITGMFSVAIPEGYVGKLLGIHWRNFGAGTASLAAYYVSAPGVAEAITPFRRSCLATAYVNESLVLPSPLRGWAPSGSVLRFKILPAAVGDDHELSVWMAFAPLSPETNDSWKAPQER